MIGQLKKLYFLQFNQLLRSATRGLRGVDTPIMSEFSGVMSKVKIKSEFRFSF